MTKIFVDQLFRQQEFLPHRRNTSQILLICSKVKLFEAPMVIVDVEPPINLILPSPKLIDA